MKKKILTPVQNRKKVTVSVLTGGNSSSKAKDNEFVRNFSFEELKKIQLRWDFVYNQKFSPIRDLIDKRFETFFKKLICLSQNKNELERKRRRILEYFYNLVFRRIESNTNLMNDIKIIDDADKKIKSSGLVGKEAARFQKIFKDLGLSNFKSIVKETFDIDDLIISDFEKSNETLESNIRSIEKENKEVWGEVDSLNNILRVAQKKIKNNKGITYDFATQVIPEIKNKISSMSEDCRFNNGKLNCSKLGRKFGVNNKTVKSWCQKLGIPIEIASLK